MKLLQLTLPTLEANLALDEALLDEHAERPDTPDTLRLWEAAQHGVVLGRSSRIEQEVSTAACRELGVPIRRRVSGGLTIVTGPGCLMFAVVIGLARRPELKSIDPAHAFVLDTLAGGLRGLSPSVHRAGTSDLALETHDGQRKFSGNAVRLTRHALLYHGTLLYDFDLAIVPRLLRQPPREPDYRRRRTHADFLANLQTDRQSLTAAVVHAWRCDGERPDYPEQATRRLIARRYAQAPWNHSR